MIKCLNNDIINTNVHLAHKRIVPNASITYALNVIIMIIPAGKRIMIIGRKRDWQLTHSTISGQRPEMAMAMKLHIALMITVIL